MYCDHCGAPLQAGTVFCTCCGNSLAARSTIKKEGSVLAFVFILLLWLLPLGWGFVGLVQQWTYFHAATQQSYFEVVSEQLWNSFLNEDLLPNAVGLLVTVVLALCGGIKLQRIGWRQFLTAVFLTLICAEGLGVMSNFYMQYLQTQSLMIYSMARSVVNVFTLPHLWRWIVLLIMLLSMSHDRLPMGLVFSVCTAGLAVWIVLGMNQVRDYLDQYISNEPQYESVLCLVRLAIPMAALSRMSVSFVALLAGKRIVSNAMAGVCAMVKVIGTVVLLPVLVFVLHLGLTGAAIVEPLVSLILGAVCLIYMIVYRNKDRAAA